MKYDPVIMKPDEGKPYDGKSPVSGHLSFDFIEGVNEQRLADRRNLLTQLSGSAQPTEPLEHYQQRVFDMLLDEETRRAFKVCLLYTSPSPRDGLLSRMPSSA